MPNQSQKASSQQVNRLALIHAGALGDLVLTLRVVEALRRRLDRAEIELVVRSSFATLVAGRSAANRTTELDRPGLHTFFHESAALDAWWRAYFETFDLVVNLHSCPESVFSRRLEACCRGRVICIDPAHRPDWTDHITDQWLFDLGNAGLELPTDVTPRIEFKAGYRFEARARLQRQSPMAGRPIALIHPGSGAKEKCWPLTNFESLAVSLIGCRLQPMVMIGPVETDVLPRPARRRLADFAPVICEPSLAEAASLLAGADVFIGNDAGMTHVAAAICVPTVALFGPTEPNVWRPLGDEVTVLRGVGSGPDPFAGLDVSAVRDAILSSLAGPSISA